MPILKRLKNLSSSRREKNKSVNRNERPSTLDNVVPLKNALIEHSTPDITRTSAGEQSKPGIVNISLSEQLWNNAYDSLRKDEAKLIQAYEVLLTKEICGDISKNDVSKTNLIVDDIGRRKDQMLDFIKSELKKTEKEAAIKLQVANVVRRVTAVKEAISTGLNPSPEATLVWTALTARVRVSIMTVLVVYF